MSITLYQAEQDMQRRIMLCADPETGELDMVKFNAIGGTFTVKVIAGVAVFKTHDVEIEGLRAQLAKIVESYEKQIKTLEANKKKLHDNIKHAMQSTGTTRVKSDDGLLDAKLYVDRDVSVVIDDGAVFDESLLSPPKAREPSKTLIKEAILRGEPISGARIVKNDRLEIK